MRTSRLPEDSPRELLVLERPPADAAALCRTLWQVGWGVLRVVDHMQALEAVRSRRFDMVVLCLPVAEAADLDLPRVLRKVAGCDYLPVAIASDSADCPLSSQFLDSGADQVLLPTDSPEQTLARLRALLRIRDRCDALESSRRNLRSTLRRERIRLRRLRRQSAILRDLAATDGLTGLRNVRSFEDALDHEFKMARRYGHPLSLLLLDVDRFKDINDGFGHPTGDCVLRNLADVLRDSVRESDLPARTGGDEMAVVLPSASREQAQALAQRVLEEARRRPILAGGRTVPLTVSIGLATWPADARITSPADLVRAADDALLRAKCTRDCIVAFGELGPNVRHPLLRTE